MNELYGKSNAKKGRKNKNIYLKWPMVYNSISRDVLSSLDLLISNLLTIWAYTKKKNTFNILSRLHVRQ